MRTSMNLSPFVAKAHFSPDNLWLKRYETFWFSSRDLSFPNASEGTQFQNLKKYIAKNVIHKTHELIMFDNREHAVSNRVNTEPKTDKIVYKYVNGNVLRDDTIILSFKEWELSDKFCSDMKRIFRDVHLYNDENGIRETEQLAEQLFQDKWKRATNDYKQFLKSLEK